MSKEDEYMQSAAEAMELVRRASSNADKGRLLKLAQAWIDLADRAHDAARRFRRPKSLASSCPEDSNDTKIGSGSSSG